MVIFLDALVTVGNRSLRYAVNMVRISESIVTIIVTNCCCNNTNQIKIAQLSEFGQLALFHEIKGHFKHVSPVNVIVVLYVTTVALVYFTQKSRKFVFVDHSFDFHFLKNAKSDGLHEALAPYSLRNFKNIEVNLTDLVEMFAVFVDLLD
jgi:hypothetical protein